MGRPMDNFSISCSPISVETYYLKESPMRPPKSNEEFLAAVETGHLLTHEEVENFSKEMELKSLVAEDSIECAQLLVLEGLLTQTEAQLVLQGTYRR